MYFISRVRGETDEARFRLGMIVAKYWICLGGDLVPGCFVFYWTRINVGVCLERGT